MTYRTIDVSREARVDLADQAAPMLQWAALADLVIDECYQRDLTPVSWKSIRRIASGFNWAHFGALAVAPIEGGRFAVIDGQHRAHAAAICGIEQVPVIVSRLPVGDQARAFAVINGSAIKVGPLQIYRAALAAGEAWAVDCRDVVEAAGCRLMTANATTSAKKPGQVFCVGAVRKWVAARAGAELTHVLRALLAHVKAYHVGAADDPAMQGNIVAELFSAQVITPLVETLRAHPDLMAVDLAGFLDDVDLLAVLATGRKIARERGDSNAKAAKVEMIVLRMRHWAREAA